MSEKIVDKEEILKNILLKAFQNSLKNLEKRTSDQMNSLINTSKQFKIIDKNIRNLIINVNSTIEKKLKLKEKTSSNKKPKKSKTQNNIHSNKFLSQTSSKKNIKSNFNIIHFTKRKASTNTENNSFENTLNPSSRNQNRKNRSLIHKMTRANTDNLVKKNLIFNNSMSTSRPIKNYKKNSEIKADLFDIQEQIKKVENTINYTEKFAHKKSISGHSADLIRNNFIKNNSKILKKKLVNKIKTFNIKPYLEKMGEKCKECIIKFCDRNDILNLIKSNKKFFISNYINYLNRLTNDFESKNTKELNKIKENHKEELEKEIPEFHFSRGSIKARNLLDDPLYYGVFYNEELSGEMRKIIIIYRILCQIFKLDNLIDIKDDNIFWNKFCVWFLNEGNKGLGNFLFEKSKEFNLDEDNIAKIEKLAKKYKKIITPSYFSKICMTTGLITFYLKDVLEYIGVIYDDRTPIKRVYINLEKELKKIDKLKEFQERWKIFNNNTENEIEKNKIKNHHISINSQNNLINEKNSIQTNNDKINDNSEKNNIISISMDNDLSLFENNKK